MRAWGLCARVAEGMCAFAVFTAARATAGPDSDLAPTAEASRSRAGRSSVDQVRLPQFVAATTVRHALAGARRRLAEPRCLQIFTEFSDPEGRTLQATLEARGRTAQQQLDDLLFYGGEHEPGCAGSATMALSTPGERVVRICPVFIRVGERNPRYAEVILLHEMLHTLGLGENPPTSSVITGAVMRRCGGPHYAGDGDVAGQPKPGADSRETTTGAGPR